MSIVEARLKERERLHLIHKSITLASRSNLISTPRFLHNLPLDERKTMDIPNAVNEDKSTHSPWHPSVMSKIISLNQTRVPSSTVSFDRHELGKILNIYGRMVATGSWRDYAIDHLADRAVFSIFRRASEVPLFRVEKNPKLAQRQGAYSVIAASGLIMKRGHELERVLRVFDKSLKLVDD